MVAIAIVAGVDITLPSCRTPMMPADIASKLTSFFLKPGTLPDAIFCDTTSCQRCREAIDVAELYMPTFMSDDASITNTSSASN
ncbi:MAG: hypothetical protein BWY82_02227 [Verrucomicrobia bacterium ADurb.Bin474]|nr:MAG: hypothetical protein BWY82_02227 [Verrucomicrobia bacterium ADurb.Bin474]